jgi:hypothetical protein
MLRQAFGAACAATATDGVVNLSQYLLPKWQNQAAFDE